MVCYKMHAAWESCLSMHLSHRGWGMLGTAPSLGSALRQGAGKGQGSNQMPQIGQELAMWDLWAGWEAAIPYSLLGLQLEAANSLEIKDNLLIFLPMADGAQL